jgi:hypothetical protein
MAIDVNYLLERLSTRQMESGGYYGTDVTKLSKELGVTPRGLRKQISWWKRSIKEFSDLRYLGKRPPSVTLNEFIEIEARMHSNPVEVKSRVLGDIRDDRLSKGLQNLPSSTFYRAMKQTDLYQFLSATKYTWFKVRGIEIPSDYSVCDERNTLSTLFTFSNLKAYGGADLQEIFDRLTNAKRHIEKYGLRAFEFYPQILTRGAHLRSLLSSIPSQQQEESQARLIFETQLAYVVECTDLFVTEVIHRKGRIHQSMNAHRQKVENQIRKEQLKTIRNNGKDMVLAHKPDMDAIHKIAYPKIDEKIRARFELLRANKNTYEFLIGLLQEFTRDGVNEFHFLLDEGKRFFDWACGETDWTYWSAKDKRALVKKPDTIRAIDLGNKDIARIIATDRVIDYIKQGKITISDSYNFQDLGKRIKEVQLCENEVFLTAKIVEQLIHGEFLVNFLPLLEATKCSKMDKKDEDNIPLSWNNLSEVLQFVSKYVRENTPGWFNEHVNLFREQTDGMFSIEYGEEEFAERLYVAIGFIGGNFRYRDSERFWNLHYFIQRHLTEQSLRLELKFIHRCMEKLTANIVEGVVIDTMGIDGRKKSILASYHGRYHTIGSADLRAVSTDMSPLYSGGIRSTDSEAMNIVEVMAEVQKICGEQVKIYTGDGHTTSRISAGMVFLSLGVVAAGRIIGKPKMNLGRRRIRRLKKNIPLLNKIGKLLRDEPILGRVMASKKHIYVDGLNVRKIVEDLGHLILYNVRKSIIPVYEICESVERSNYLKRKTRILEGSKARVESHNVGLSLIAAELVISVAGLYHTLNGWSGPESPFNLSDIRIFVPA